MSASRIRRLSSGHSSPSPSSDVTPGFTSWSAIRIVPRNPTSRFFSSETRSPIILSVEELSPLLRFRLQLIAMAVRVMSNLPERRIY
jgi:hypothetical protein